MTNIIVEFYNMILREGYYPKRQLNLVDITLEKGKGQIIGKLRMITLIEGDLQILIRKYLRSESEKLNESDKRFLKAIYGSRKKIQSKQQFQKKDLYLIIVFYQTNKK